ncbi:ABC transporter ATP-binding protein [Fimbriiglobus ruber]|uniref:ABC transporter ATP-binding protein n=1 Tax=Fimbriiglobus ruber TaxID=1908690 RepID=A0A225DY39_9BACT|nr:ABC transporter ATP-binding protein [Fimbriiglobus ruber]
MFAGVSLTARRGELLAVLGPNGAGKTTLLRALARLTRPLAGTVTLDGRDLWATHNPGMAAVAFAPQVLAPTWPLTVREFVALGRAPHRGWWRPLSKADWRTVEATLDLLALGPFVDRPVTELSGGEWQRVRLAKSLAQEPTVLLLDEPTAHLDPRAQFELLSAVRALAADRQLAVVMTLHDLNLVGPWADRVAVLASGGILAEGTPAEVLTEATLTQAYNVHLHVAPHPLTAAPAVSLAPATP